MISAAVLAGGLATRLRPLTAGTPKSLLQVNGEPFIAHQLRLLRASGIEHVVLCVSFLGEMIQRAVGDGCAFGLHVDYSFDGERMMGTAGAIKSALPKLGEAFFVLYGDSYLPCDYAAVAAKFTATDKLALMTVFRNRNMWDVSNIEFEDGKIIAYDKRTPSSSMQYIDYGLGVFSAAAFAVVPSDRPSDLADLYRNLLARGEVIGFEVLERFYEVGSIKGLDDTAEYLARRGDR
ncbi:MAG: NTP transferase domain-containing protein [Acidobacteriia bacterium]|nr:NTP transferase domain-containing protein [Terriglobia bacterium]